MKNKKEKEIKVETEKITGNRIQKVRRKNKKKQITKQKNMNTKPIKI